MEDYSAVCRQTLYVVVLYLVQKRYSHLSFQGIILSRHLISRKDYYVDSK